MSILELLRSRPALATPAPDNPYCRGGELLWDGGHYTQCGRCGRIGPVSVMYTHPHRKVFDLTQAYLDRLKAMRRALGRRP